MGIFSKKEEKKVAAKKKAPEETKKTPVKKAAVSHASSRRRGLILKPWLSEKAHNITPLGQYTFLVDKSATKNEVRGAIEEMYGVHVVSVDTMPLRGKAKRFRGKVGKPQDGKKAIVTLKSGEKIETF